MTRQRVLITGGFGFVGSSVARCLRGCGYTVVKTTRRQEVGERDAIVIDYGDKTSLARAMIGIDAVVHLAGTAHVHPSGDRTRLYSETVVELTRNVWAAAASAGVGRFVHASTIKVYDEGSGEPINEASPCLPKTPYGVAKLEAERFLCEQATAINAPALTILRFPPIFGPGMRGSVRHIFWAASRGLPLPLRTPRGRRHILYVGNASRLIRNILEGVLTESVYLPHDSVEWTAASLYEAVYEIAHGRAMPAWLLLPLSGFVAVRIKNSARFGSLVADFRLASKFQHQYAQVPFVDSETALSDVVRAIVPSLTVKSKRRI